MAPNLTDIQLNCTPAFLSKTTNISDIPQAFLYGPHIFSQNKNVSCFPKQAMDNLTIPLTDPTDWEASMLLLDTLHWYYLPPLMALGILGNVISSCILLLPPLRRESSSHYLAALSLADTAYLISLFSLWLSVVGVDLYNRHGWCQFMYFITSLSTFLPLWFMVLFSLERVIVHRRSANYRSRRHSTGHSTGHVCDQMVIIGVLIVGVVIHVNTSLTVGVVDFPGFKKCMLLPRFIPYLKLLSIVESIVSIVIPYSIIIAALLTVIIIPCVRRCRCKETRFNVHDSTRSQSASTLKLTWLTILTLSVFLLTRLPTEVFRLINMAHNFSDVFVHPDAQEFLIQQLAEKLQLLSFVVKPLFYVLLHPMLRKSVRKRMRSACLRRRTSVATVLATHVISIEQEILLNPCLEMTSL